MKKIIIAILSVAILTGCCSACRQRQKNAKPLQGTEWHMVQLGGTEMDLPINSFNLLLGVDNSIAGVAACNRLLGHFTVTEKQDISFGQVGTTMMLCPHNADLEAKFIEMLGGITHYDIDGDKLILMQDGVIKAIFKALPSIN